MSRQNRHPFSIVFSASFYFYVVLTPKLFADAQLFHKAEWIVDGAADTGTNPRPITITVENGQLVHTFSELKIFYELPGYGIRQILSVKGNGALRPAVPDGSFGGTFYTTGYWDCSNGLSTNMMISDLDIRLDPITPVNLILKGKASNHSTFEAKDFTLRLFPPTNRLVKLAVSYTLTATSNFCIDPHRQLNNEGFRLVRIASNYLTSDVHDSDQAGYINSSNHAIRVALANKSGFIFSALETNPHPRLSLIHSDAKPADKPTL